MSWAALAAVAWALGAPLKAQAEGPANRLIAEKSPYLLQHAHNPVDWYPWGEEAFQRARREDKPIFLSIGYSTCHWCHVMEQESFSNPEIAAALNEHFVSIKVDREERPDVDKVYMAAAAAAGWGGGWPLNLWLTPQLKPFFGGTYFPPDEAGGRPGLKQLLPQIAELWRTQRAGLASDADGAADALRRYVQPQGSGGPLPAEALDEGFKALRARFDPSSGGFSGAPKFPMPVYQGFLLRYFARTKNPEALELALHTLRQMADGGIYDALGGGFHRYSTDERWRVPHFEKMLYDNAQLAVNDLEAYQASQDARLAQTARETLDYVLRDMTHPEGGFYSAEDADSLPPGLKAGAAEAGQEHQTEGAYYLWTRGEILEAAGPEAGEIFCYRYGVEAEGNVKPAARGQFQGQNILYAAHSVEETAGRFAKPETEVRAALAEARLKLYRRRLQRPRPSRDDKVLVSWNGLMLSALAKGSEVLKDPKYLEAAVKDARFIREKLYDAKTGRLLHRWREGESRVPGMAADYAFLAQGLLDLYEASFDPAWLQWAVRLSETQNELFLDREGGGLYTTAQGEGGSLLVRTQEDSDNVEPSASSVAALNLLRLAQFTGRKDFRSAAEQTLAFFASQMKDNPLALAQMLSALDYALSPPRQIIIAGPQDAPETQAMLGQVYGRFLPDKILMVVAPGESRGLFEAWLPFLKNLEAKKGKATAYVCRNYACELPTQDLREFQRILDEQTPARR